MVKRCKFQLAMGDDYTQVVKDNMLQLFNGIDTSLFRFCAIEKEELRQKSDFGIVAYFFREQNEMDDYIFYNTILWNKVLFPNDSEELFSRLVA